MANYDTIVETNLSEVAAMADFDIQFLTSPISVSMLDYKDLKNAVKDCNFEAIQTFLWKYGVNAMYGISH